MLISLIIGTFMVFPAKCPKCDVKVFPFGHWWLRRGVPLAHGAAAKELDGESQGRGSLVGCRLWGHIESDTTEAT